MALEKSFRVENVNIEDESYLSLNLPPLDLQPLRPGTCLVHDFDPLIAWKFSIPKLNLFESYARIMSYSKCCNWHWILKLSSNFDSFSFSFWVLAEKKSNLKEVQITLNELWSFISFELRHLNSLKMPQNAKLGNIFFSADN